MNLSRRAVLGLGAGAGLIGFAGAAGFVHHRMGTRHGSDDVRPVVVRAVPLGPLLPSDPTRRRFDDLVFRTGLVLAADDPGFGGWSALWRSPDGGRLVAVSDNAQWLTAATTSDAAGITGLAGAEMAPLLGEDGEPLRHGPAYDTESLAIGPDGVAYVGIERVHQIRRFAAWGSSGVAAHGVPLPMPPEVAGLPENRSLESVDVAPPGHPLAGRVVTIAEGNDDEASPTPGWVVTGPNPFAFRAARSDAFNVTDMKFLPSGELLLLERHFSIGRGVACRMRRVAADAIRPGATIDGPVIFRADRAFAIDNMEGLAVHRDAAGRTVLTMISDDNFSPIQRTILLEFELAT